MYDPRGADDDDGDNVRGSHSGIFEPPAGQVRGGPGHGAVQRRYLLRGHVPHRPETEAGCFGTVSFFFLSNSKATRRIGKINWICMYVLYAFVLAVSTGITY